MDDASVSAIAEVRHILESDLQRLQSHLRTTRITLRNLKHSVFHVDAMLEPQVAVRTAMLNVLHQHAKCTRAEADRDLARELCLMIEDAYRIMPVVVIVGDEQPPGDELYQEKLKTLQEDLDTKETALARAIEALSDVQEECRLAKEGLYLFQQQIQDEELLLEQNVARGARVLDTVKGWHRTGVDE